MLSWQLVLWKRIFLTWNSCSIKHREDCLQSIHELKGGRTNSWHVSVWLLVNRKLFICTIVKNWWIFVYLSVFTDWPPFFPPQLHHRSLADLQPDMRCRDPVADGQVPGVAFLFADSSRPAWWRMRRGQTYSQSGLLPPALQWSPR